MTIRKKGLRVPPMSTDSIESTAEGLRSLLGVDGGIKVIDLIELVLPEMIPSFSYEILNVDALGQAHARTFPDSGKIDIREDVYENAVSLNRNNTARYGRDNFTLAHELGHLFLHKGAANFQRSVQNLGCDHKKYEDSEWQADTFAAAFLMPSDQIRLCNSAVEVQKRFLVSHSAAKIRLEKLIKQH